VSPSVWLRQQRSLLPSPLTKLSTEGVEVPIAQAFETAGPLHHLEPRADYSSKYVSFKGSELMMEISVPPAIGGVPSTIPRGGVIGMIPLNPLYSDGLRVSRSLSQFDQFRIRSISVEYVPVCPATTAGGLMMAAVNDGADMLGVEGGFPAMRDLLTRDGSVAFSPYVGAVATQGDSLLKWYFTESVGNEGQSQPGLVYVMAATDMSNSAATSIPLGLIWLHYEFETRAPSIERQIPQAYSLSTASLSFSSSVAINAGVAVPAATVPSQFQNTTTVGWGTIVSADDAAAGSAAWRTWIEQDTGNTMVLGPGMLLFWRGWANNGSVLINFYPSLAAALSAEYGAVGYQFTVATGAVLRGFKVWNVCGCPLVGDA